MVTIDEPISLFGYDQAGYYNYLPALFVYNDLNFEYLNPSFCDKKTFTSSVLDKNGHPTLINCYSTGVSILLSPFFGIAHLEAKLSKAPPNGFSPPYQKWIFIGHWIYVLLALLLLRKVLSLYYTDSIIAWTLLLICMGTNFAYYAIYEPLMSHNYSFFLFSLCLFLSTQWFQKQRAIVLIALGFAIGLLVNIRLPNIIYILVLGLWEINSFQKLKNRFLLLYKHKKSLLMAILAGCCGFIPQCLYWYTQTGFYFLNPYGDKGVFFWTDPMVGELLWGYKKGWLVYSPLMLLSLLGFYFLYQQNRKLLLGILSYTLLNWYILSCWWCWWYGGSFGMRAFIESMVPLSFTLAATMQWFFSIKMRQFMLAILTFLGIGLNLFQIYQYSHSCIHNFAMTRKAYWIVFGKIPPLSPETSKAYDEALLGVYMNHMTLEERQETKTYNERLEAQLKMPIPE